MALSNYTELESAISNWTHRSDLVSIVPELIKLAEIRINGDLDARLQDSTVTLATVASNPNVTLPDDLINIRTIYIDSDSDIVLKLVTPDEMRVAYPSSSTGRPSVYSLVGNKVVLAPTPDAVYNIGMVYKAKVPALSDLNPTNWLLTNFPNVYLFAALCECATFIKDDSRIPLWEQKYQEAIGAVNAQDWYSGSTLMVRSDARAV